jgi:hypothetical protein
MGLSPQWLAPLTLREWTTSGIAMRSVIHTSLTLTLRTGLAIPMGLPSGLRQR